MNKTIASLVMSFSLLASAQAFTRAHEGYGVPGTPQPVPGGTLWHVYNCTPVGLPMIGVGYQLSVATAARPPKYNVVGCSLKSRAVSPTAQWQDLPMTEVYQDEKVAKFAGQYAKVTVNKRNSFSAQVVLSNNYTLNCVWAPVAQ